MSAASAAHSWHSHAQPPIHRKGQRSHEGHMTRQDDEASAVMSGPSRVGSSRRPSGRVASAGASFRRIDCIVGARPNFVKIAPIIRAFQKRNGFITRLIHTGQHYDVAMNQVFFTELGIPQPDVNLEVGSGTCAAQTARIMLGLEPVFKHQRPDLVVVVGDVNSTAAATYVAAQLRIPVAHVEAGLRSFDRTMPEEVNRLVTDRLADLLLATERSAVSNLIREGIAPDRIKFVGNVMIDTLHHCLDRAMAANETLGAMGAPPELVASAARGFGLVTMHRPSNVDDPRQLQGLLAAFREIAQTITLVLPLHPRTRARLSSAGLADMLRHERILVTPPLSYLRMLGLMREAKFAITDSGGVQEETTALGIPCLTIRDTTERPATLSEGSNTLVGTSPSALARAVKVVLESRGKHGSIPELWDGHAADRIAAEIDAFLCLNRIATTAAA